MPCSPGLAYDRLGVDRAGDSAAVGSWMMSEATSTDRQVAHGLTPQQLRFFNAFGFLHVPGFLGDDVDGVTDAFEEVFAAHDAYDMFQDVHFGERRQVIPKFFDHHPRLRALESDPRILGVLGSLFPGGFEYRQSDGNLLDCDTAWHCDIYDSPLDRFCVKLFFYLDELDGDSGALRVIPGTSDFRSDFAAQMRTDLDPWPAIEERFGVRPEEIPSFPLTNRPGDLVIGNYRTVHATFGGRPRRRLFTMNYREVEPTP
jgi:hypothetical protein